MTVFIVIIIGEVRILKKMIFNSEVSEEYYLKIAKRIVESKPVIVTITGGEPMSVFSKIKSSIDLFLKKIFMLRLILMHL